MPCNQGLFLCVSVEMKVLPAEPGHLCHRRRGLRSGTNRNGRQSRVDLPLLTNRCPRRSRTLPITSIRHSRKRRRRSFGAARPSGLIGRHRPEQALRTEAARLFLCKRVGHRNARRSFAIASAGLWRAAESQHPISGAATTDSHGQSGLIGMAVSAKRAFARTESDRQPSIAG